MLGGLLALLSAVGFAFETATARRGVVTASVTQALAVTLPIGVPIFLLLTVMCGALHALVGFSAETIAYLALAGVLHFAWGRYCNYRASKAMGANLVAPVQQSNMLVTLALAIWILGEHLTLLRIMGIGLVVLGPALTSDRTRHRSPDTIAGAPIERSERKMFQPNYAEGYLFALLSSTGYGISPILVRLALEKHADLPNVPLVIDLAKTDEQRQILKLIFARQVMGRPFLAPPGVPKDRADALRKAFMDTMADKEFLADTGKAQMEIMPVSGENLEKLVKEVYATPKELADKAASFIARK